MKSYVVFLCEMKTSLKGKVPVSPSYRLEVACRRSVVKQDLSRRSNSVGETSNLSN